jgi:hypothetical protein
MKVNLMIIALVGVFSFSCSTIQPISKSSDVRSYKNSNLVQMSSFTIATPDKDTLYIKTDDEIGSLLYNLWMEGCYDDTDTPTVVIGLKSDDFNELTKFTLAKN